MIKVYQLLPGYLLALLILVIALPGCTLPDPGIYKNNQIPKGKQDDFHDLNTQLFQAVESGHEKEVDLLLSADLLAANYNADKIAYRLKSAKYKMVDEYYVVHKHNGSQTFKTGKAYYLNYTSVAREMYIAFYLPDEGDERYMITVVYARYKYGWRVASLAQAQYCINGKTAPDLYRQAKADYNQGYFASAVNNLELAEKCIRPSEVWQYPNETDINDLYSKAIETANETYHFPIVVKAVSTSPRIFRVINQSIPEGTYPAIYYQSAINLKDTVALRKENTAIKNVIEHVLPGITKNKRYILYSAFNEMPSPVKYVKSYDVTDRLQ
ncbi:hypothetical protein ACFGVR_23580 [Mucilaginibacter sp. AW1-3]